MAAEGAEGDILGDAGAVSVEQGGKQHHSKIRGDPTTVHQKAWNHGKQGVPTEVNFLGFFPLTGSMKPFAEKRLRTGECFDSRIRAERLPAECGPSGLPAGKLLCLRRIGADRG